MPNYTYVDHKLRLSVTFIWSEDVSKTMVDQFRTWQHSDKPPSVIVASTGLQLLKTRNTTDQLLDEYKRNLTRLVQAIDYLDVKNTQVLWKLMEPVDHAAKVWSAPLLISSRGTSPGAGAHAGAGVHLSRTALQHCAQSLLNMFCNDHMNFNDGTCCASPEPATPLTAITFALFLVW
ncbi:Uncharacterized protein OBRU01_01651 [Operophtera brumata]|uniref:Uncharacterized protein n=1 Tax=Operophtera brumata TaxID=104452 RepID=A0A0L7LT95_OPEBR|nr:Uncharacterized protein OBRU01_01651 [Operophtera brumata]